MKKAYESGSTSIDKGKKCLSEQCGLLCGHDGATHFVMRMELVEGDVLKYLEGCTGPISLRSIMADLDWDVCLISMCVGSLLRNGLVRATEREGILLIELNVKPRPAVI